MSVKNYRKILWIAFVCVLFFMTGTIYCGIRNQIPGKFRIFVNKTEEINLPIPVTSEVEVDNQAVVYVNHKKLSSRILHLNLDQNTTVVAKKEGSCLCRLKLLGIIPLKNVQVEFIEKKELYPCGFPIGIEVGTNGILVLGTGEISGEDGFYYEPALNLIETGDYIEKINGTQAESIEVLKKEIAASKDGELSFLIRRNGTQKKIEMKAVKGKTGEFQAGLWVRDSAQGIGTLTYVDEAGNFGALGHGITDVDTGSLIEIQEGRIYPAVISRIIKGKEGEPGEMIGILEKNERCLYGTLYDNTEEGIFGNVKPVFSEEDRKAYPIALKQEIETGKAYVLCQMEDKPEMYEIEIEKLNQNTEELTKGMVLHITDRALLEETNGIIQGMSGSPIIQNGKIIGAVTHVFVKDSTRGYGIFIENMLKGSRE